MAGLGWVSNPAESRAPLLLSVFWTLFGLTTIFLCLRLWIRRLCSRWQADDCMLVLAWLCLVGYTGIHQYAISLGYGKHILDVPSKNFRAMSMCGDVAVIFTMIGINAAKISFAATMLRLTGSLWRKTNRLIWFIIITVILTAIPAIILPWTVCKPSLGRLTILPLGKCLDPVYSVRYGVFQGIYTAITDFTLALLPWKILWTLQMRGVEKIGVGIAMSLGFVAGVMAIIRAASIPTLMASDSSYDGIMTVLWADVELSATMIAACIPVLRKMISEEVRTRTRSGRSGTSGSRTNPKSNGISSTQNTTGVNKEVYVHELSAICVPVPPESARLPDTPLTRWYTTPTPDNGRRSDESTFLRKTEALPAEGMHGQSLEKERSRSDCGSFDANPEPITPWPEAVHMRVRSI